MTPFYDRNGITIYCGDCLEIMPELEPGVDAIIADPPYYKIVSNEWDNQWKGFHKYIKWLELMVIQIKRVLSTKGSFYIFADDKYCAYVQVMIDKYLTLLNSLVWFKINNQSIKAAPNLRSYAPMTERILFYTPQLCPTGLETVMLDINNFGPLREYFRDYQEAIGLSKKEILDKLGQKADHCFRWKSSQWDLPTKETYEQLGKEFYTNGFVRREYEALRREYEALRREYEALRREYEALRRVFNASSDTLDVITGPIISQKENSDHPTTKPLWLIARLIRESTNQKCKIIDPFIGSGTTLVAAQNEGRRAIGIELSEEYCQIAVERLRQPSFFSIPDNSPLPPPKQLSLIEQDNG